MLDNLSLIVVSPEILLLALTCVIALVDLGVKTRLRNLTYVLSLLTLARQPDFPRNALGLRVQAGRHCGEVVKLSPDGRQFWLVNERSGATQLFDADFWRQRAQA